jgi:hypothetical protein
VRERWRNGEHIHKNCLRERKERQTNSIYSAREEEDKREKEDTE